MKKMKEVMSIDKFGGIDVTLLNQKNLGHVFSRASTLLSEKKVMIMSTTFHSIIRPDLHSLPSQSLQ
jgi:hypothetical protein